MFLNCDPRAQPPFSKRATAGQEDRQAESLLRGARGKPARSRAIQNIFAKETSLKESPPAFSDDDELSAASASIMSPQNVG